MRSLMDSVSDEAFIEIVKNSHSYKECLQKFGYISTTGPVYEILKKKIEKLNIDVSHFKRLGLVLRTRENVFVENSTCDSKTLRNWFLKEDVPYKCSICGQEPFWNGQEMIMILDHINGKNHDNRFENIRWVCPNCNSQLPTTGSKNAKRKLHSNEIQIRNKNKESVESIHKCAICGAKVSSNGNVCRKCLAKKNRKAERPSDLDLAKMIKERGFTQVGKCFGVSDNTIKKWCKSYGIPHKFSELVAWYNKQMNIVEQPTEVRANGVATPSKQVQQIDPNTGAVINVFPSIHAACAYFGGKNINSISMVCRGLRKTAYGYCWKFV